MLMVFLDPTVGSSRLRFAERDGLQRSEDFKRAAAPSRARFGVTEDAHGRGGKNVIVITGADAGAGRVVARCFGGEGWRVAVRRCAGFTAAGGEREARFGLGAYAPTLSVNGLLEQDEVSRDTSRFILRIMR